MHPAIIEISRLNKIKKMNPIPTERPRGIQTRQYSLQSKSDMDDLADLKKAVKVRNVVPNLDDMSIMVAFNHIH